MDSRPVDSEPPFRVHLYQALPKGDKLDTVIQKAVECGVCAVTPFESSRCIVRAKSDTEARKTERRARIAAEAAKQCGRGILPDVSPTVDFHTMLDDAAKSDLVLFCYEGEGTESLKSVLESSGNPRDIAIVIGSEGGFSVSEAESAAKVLKSVGLGKRILRSESASGFALACISYQFEL